MSLDMKTYDDNQIQMVLFTQSSQAFLCWRNHATSATARKEVKKNESGSVGSCGVLQLWSTPANCSTAK